MVLEVIERAASIMRRHPKVVLPQVLTWIPAALFSLLFAAALTKYAAHLTMRGFVTALSDIGATFNALMPYLAVFTVVLVLGVLVGVFIGAVYPPLVQQAMQRKPVMLSAAFRVAQSRFGALLWSYLILFGFALAALVVLIALALTGTAGIIAAVLGIIVLVFVLVFVSWQLEPVVVIEQQGGIKALQRSFAIVRHAFWQALGVVVFVIIISALVSVAFKAVPQAGYLLSLVAALFTATLAALAKTVFYYRHVKKKRL